MPDGPRFVLDIYVARESKSLPTAGFAILIEKKHEMKYRMILSKTSTNSVEHSNVWGEIILLKYRCYEQRPNRIEKPFLENHNEGSQV